jgi:hypothetical protein
MDSSVARVTQIQAAHRQLEGGIRLHFSNTDPVVVHSVVGNAATLLGDLSMNLGEGKNWDRVSMEVCGFDKAKYFNAMRGGVYFLKHGHRGNAGNKIDPTVEFEFLATETEGVIFWAIQNVAIVDTISTVEGIFQLWFLSSRYELLGRDYRNMPLAVTTFPRLHMISGEDQRSAGARALAVADQMAN